MIWTGFVLGLAGSLHCAGMCGPLAMALPGSPRRLPFTIGRIAYNLGRLTTYTLLGLVFGLLGHTVVMIGWQRWLSIGAGVAMLVGLLLSRKAGSTALAVTLVTFLKRALGRLLNQRHPAGLFAFGALNGLLPCGLVYAGAAGASSTGSMLAGASYMAVFGLGTLPMMLGLALSPRLLPVSWRLQFARIVPASLVLVGGLLILRGLGLGIPYLSPAFDPTQGVPSCHASVATPKSTAAQ